MDSAQFKELFMPFHTKLYRIAMALLGNRDDAEDILQETYCKLWDRREQLDEVNNAEAFSVTMIKNLCIDFLRSQQTKPDETEIDSVSLPAGRAPDSEMEEKETLQKVRQCISNLPENQQQVIRLRSIAECSIEETAKITGFSSANIRVLLSRARTTIKEEIVRKYGYGR